MSCSTNWIKSLRTSRRSVTRNHRSGLSFAIRPSSCFADAAQQSARLPDNTTKSECLFYRGLRSQCIFFVAAYSFKLSRSVECRLLTSQPTPARVCGEMSLCKNIYIVCRQWRFQHSGSTRVFDYALYCRTQACMLCMFVLPPTLLIKVVNSGSFHWALSVFIYFRFMLAFRVQFAACNLTCIKKYRSQQRRSQMRSLALYSGSSIGARAALCN